MVSQLLKCKHFQLQNSQKTKRFPINSSPLLILHLAPRLAPSASINPHPNPLHFHLPPRTPPLEHYHPPSLPSFQSIQQPLPIAPFPLLIHTNPSPLSRNIIHCFQSPILPPFSNVILNSTLGPGRPAASFTSLNPFACFFFLLLDQSAPMNSRVVREGSMEREMARAQMRVEETSEVGFRWRRTVGL